MVRCKILQFIHLPNSTKNRCNGMIGCTDTRYSCNGFSTVVPSTSYMLSQNETYTVGGNDISIQNGTVLIEDDDYIANNYTEELSNEEAIMYEEIMYQEVRQYDFDSTSGYFTILGVFAGMMSMISFFAGYKSIRHMQLKKPAIDSSTLIDEESAN